MIERGQASLPRRSLSPQGGLKELEQEGEIKSESLNQRNNDQNKKKKLSKRLSAIKYRFSEHAPTGPEAGGHVTISRESGRTLPKRTPLGRQGK